MTRFANSAKPSNKKMLKEAPGSKLKPNKRQLDEEKDDSEDMDDKVDEDTAMRYLGSDEESVSEEGEDGDEEGEDEMEDEEASDEDEEESEEDEEENGEDEVSINTPVQKEGKAKVNSAAQKKFKREFKGKCIKCKQVGHKASICSENPNRNKCFSCGKEGHKAKECSTGKGHKFTTCFVCSENGHFARECPKNTKKGDKETGRKEKKETALHKNALTPQKGNKQIPLVSANGNIGGKRKMEQGNVGKSILNKKSKKGKVVTT